MTPERWHKIEPLLNEALDLPPKERNEFLTAACNGNPSLRLEIESLLAQEERIHSFIEEPILPLPDDLKQLVQENPTKPSLPTEPLTGKQLGKYKIRSLLGKGGMGEVYLAYDSMLDREVALKFLPPDLARDPEQIERFKREARTLAKLENHPNIAVIHELEPNEPTPFLALEYVPGQTLAERLQQGALPLAEALPIFRQIAAALAEAQKRGIIHRDLKPANIKITPDGRVKVLDFGLAKILSHQAQTADLAEPQFVTTRSFWTTDRQVIIGTVPYMSPEQTRGLPLDQRTDIWAFGCLMFEALTGQRPFHGSDTFDLFHSIRTQGPDWQLLPPTTPTPIRTLLQQCLRKEPEERLSSASEVQRVIAEEEKTRTSPFISALKQWKKQALVAIAVSLAIILGIVYHQPIQARLTTMMAALTPIPKDKTLAILPFKEAGDLTKEDKVGRGLAKALQNVLASVADLRVLPFAEAVQANLVNATPDRVMKSLGVNLLLNGEVQREGDALTIYYRVQNNQGATIFSGTAKGRNDEYARLQSEIVATVTTALKLDLITLPRTSSFQDQSLEAPYLEALSALQSDLTRETIVPIIKSLDTLQTKEPKSARVLAAFSQAYFHKAQLEDNLQDANTALDFAEQSIQLDPQAIEVQLVSGQAWYFLEKYDEAIARFRGVREKQPSNLDAILGLAWAYEDNKQFKEAEQTFQIAVDYWPNYWGGHNELGSFYFNRGRYQQALQEWRVVVGLNPDSASGAVNIGNAYIKLGNLAEAEAAFRQALGKAAENKPTTTEAYLGWGTSRYYQTDYSGAARVFSDGITFDPNSYLLRLGLGDALHKMTNREEEAAEAYQRAFSLLQQHEQVPVGLARLAEVIAKRSQIQTRTASHRQADQQNARKLMQRALTAEPQNLEILASAILVYQLLDNQKQAVEYVALALKQGLSLAELEQEPRLQSLRITEQYQETTKPYRKTD